TGAEGTSSDRLPGGFPVGLPVRRPPFRKWRAHLAGGEHAAGDDTDIAGAGDRRAGGPFVRRSHEMDGGGRFLSSLASWLVGRGDAASAAADRPPVSDGIVLPRFLRRPVRLFGRMVSGDVEAPRYAGSILTLGFLAVSSAYGAYLGGEWPVV